MYGSTTQLLKQDYKKYLLYCLWYGHFRLAKEVTSVTFRVTNNKGKKKQLFMLTI